MTRTEQNRQESKSSLKAKHKVEVQTVYFFASQIYLHLMYCAGILSDFARNKVTADVGCVHVLIYNARV